MTIDLRDYIERETARHPKTASTTIDSSRAFRSPGERGCSPQHRIVLAELLRRTRHHRYQSTDVLRHWRHTFLEEVCFGRTNDSLMKDPSCLGARKVRAAGRVHCDLRASLLVPMKPKYCSRTPGSRGFLPVYPVRDFPRGQCTRVAYASTRSSAAMFKARSRSQGGMAVAINHGLACNNSPRRFTSGMMRT